MLKLANLAENWEYYLQKNTELIIDDFNYQSNTEIQATYAEGGDGGNPVILDNTAPRIGNYVGQFGLTHSTGTSTWTANGTIGPLDLSEFFNATTGVPKAGFIKALITRLSTSGISATGISIRIGSDSSNYGTWTPTLVNNVSMTGYRDAATSITVTGTPDWTAVDYIQIRVTTTGSATGIYIAGLRLERSVGITEGIWTEDTTQNTLTNAKHLFYVSINADRPALVVTQTTIGGSNWNAFMPLAGRTYRDFTSIMKFKGGDLSFSAQGYMARQIGIFCRKSGNNYYTATLDAAADTANITRWDNGVATVVASKSLTRVDETDYWLKLEVSGSRFILWVSTDGVSYTKYVDTTDTTYTSGQLGIFTRNDTGFVEYVTQFEAYEKEYVKFDDWSFHQRGQVTIDNIDELNAPNTELNFINLAATNRSGFLSKYNRTKFVNVKGTIFCSTPEELLYAVDDMKEHLFRESKNLIVGHEAASGRFIERLYTGAVAINLEDAFSRKFENRSFIPFSITFEVPTGFATNPKILTLPSYSFNSAQYTLDYDFDGTAPALPSITFTLTTAAGNGISFYNITTNRTITVQNSSNFANNDVVIINFQANRVTVNEVPIAYSGSIDDKFLQPGKNRIKVLFISSATIDQQSGVTATGGSWQSIKNDRYFAQSFQVSASTTYSQVDVRASRYLAPAVGLTLRVETDSAGSPSGTLADSNATKTILDANITEDNLGLSTFTFPADITLATSTTYWLVIKAAAAYSTGFYQLFRTLDNSYPTYTSKSTIDSGANWTTNTNNDWGFRIFRTGSTNVGTMQIVYNPRYI